MKMMVIIQGQTGTGKTDLAYQIAKSCNGEIISADSRQIYRMADIGTNKEVFSDIPTHLIDIVNPNESYSAWEFRKDCLETLHTILAKNKLPIIVGGTNFYIDVLTGRRKLSPIDEAFKLFENEQQKLLKDIDLTSLHKMLSNISPEVFSSLNNSEMHNKMRLIRKIAMHSYYKSLPQYEEINPLDGFFIMQIGIQVDKQSLEDIIATRTEKMFQKGLIKEAADIAIQFGTGCTIMQTIGYKELIPVINHDKHELKKIKNEIMVHTLQYAKRQLTWMKKDENISWIDKRDDLSNKVISEVIKKIETSVI